MVEKVAADAVESLGEKTTLELLDRAVAGMGGQSRAGQHEMAKHVTRAIETGEHLLVQAGTGTGKSLAYLIPLIAHSMDSDKPTLVSTATLALQTQIVGRDLPRLLETINPALERPVNVALVKGRANYVCRQKLEGGFPSRGTIRGSAVLPGRGHQRPALCGVHGRDRSHSWARKWSGFANGPKRPLPATVTNLCPGSRTVLGGRSP